MKTHQGHRASTFAHRWNKTATKTLAKLPMLDRVVIFYLRNIADDVRVTEKMFPSLHRYPRWGCKIIEVPEPEPEPHVSLDEVPNACGCGRTKHCIAPTSDLES